MKFTWTRRLLSSITMIFLVCLSAVDAGARRSSGIPSSTPTPGEAPIMGQSGGTGPLLIQPEDLASILTSSKDPKPLIIQVGFQVLYVQARIPGSEFIGPGLSPDAIRQLRKRIEPLPRTQAIVLYCGCCPWSECPNMKPAYKELGAMGFKNVKLLYIAHNFGEDWVGKNYPTEKGK